MQTGYEDIRAEGAELIAISSDPLAVVDSTQQALEVTYPLLSDKNSEVIIAYNVRDPGDADIARPATYIIDGGGRVAWKFLDVKTGGRLGPDQIITALKKM